jgi:hypothetical protein
MHKIEHYQDPYYPDIQGLQLVADDHVQAVLVNRPTRTDLVMQVRGPLDIEQAREIIVGLLDLLVHHDNMASKHKKR